MKKFNSLILKLSTFILLFVPLSLSPVSSSFNVPGNTAVNGESIAEIKAERDRMHQENMLVILTESMFMDVLQERICGHDVMPAIGDIFNDVRSRGRDLIRDIFKLSDSQLHSPQVDVAVEGIKDDFTDFVDDICEKDSQMYLDIQCRMSSGPVQISEPERRICRIFDLKNVLDHGNYNGIQVEQMVLEN